MSQITLDDVKDYLEQYHAYAGYSMALCVWHDDTSPSMQLTERGYYCKSCEASGSLLKLYNKVSGRPIQSEKKVYNPSAWIWKQWERFGSISDITDIAHRNIMKNPAIGHYLYKRGLSLCHIERGYLGYLEGYYLFPIKDSRGVVVSAVARASPTIQTKTNRYSVSDKEVKLYIPDMELVNSAEEIYVCYGTLDAWSLLLADYPSITGISGKSLNAVYLEKYRKPINIISDKKEERAAMRLQTELGWRGRRLDIRWPEGCKDLNDIHTVYGLDTMKLLIEEAKEKYHYD